MTTHEAKQILRLYQPWTREEPDDEMRTALAQVEQDPELAAWFSEYTALQSGLRAKFKEIQVPEALKEQIISERKARLTIRNRRKVALSVLGVAAVVFLILGVAGILFWPDETQRLAGFQNRMVGSVVRSYPRMDLETSNLNQIRQYFSEHRGLADYVLPAALNQTPGTGCKLLSWQGKTVSMVCFHGGKALSPKKADVYLFVIAKRDLPDAPPDGAPPKFGRVSRLSVGSWTKGNLTYVLAAEGDEHFLRKFL